MFFKVSEAIRFPMFEANRGCDFFVEHMRRAPVCKYLGHTGVNDLGIHEILELEQIWSTRGCRILANLGKHMIPYEFT